MNVKEYLEYPNQIVSTEVYEMGQTLPVKVINEGSKELCIQNQNIFIYNKFQTAYMYNMHLYDIVYKKKKS